MCESGLPAGVGVMDEPLVGSAAMKGHLQRVDDELVAHVLGHRPADDHPRERVLDRGAAESALPGAPVGDVGAPQNVRSCGPELALD